MQSDYHNLPTVNGTMQMNGEEYKASSIVHSFTEDGGKIAMDISGAYPAEAHLREYTRCVTLDASGLTLDDSWSFDDDCEHPVILNFITYEKPVLSNESPDVLLIGELGTLKTGNSPSHIDIEELPMTDPRHHQPRPGPALPLQRHGGQVLPAAQADHSRGAVSRTAD